jgi:hypothetical protein
LKTLTEVEQWCLGAAEEFGDPAIPVCQLLCRWEHNPAADGGQRSDLACGMYRGRFCLTLNRIAPCFLTVVDGPPAFDAVGDLRAFGAEQFAPGLWSLTPSLYLPGVLHAFVVLYDVPNPAPWERTLVIVEDLSSLPSVATGPRQKRSNPIALPGDGAP